MWVESEAEIWRRVDDRSVGVKTETGKDTPYIAKDATIISFEARKHKGDHTIATTIVTFITWKRKLWLK